MSNNMNNNLLIGNVAAVVSCLAFGSFAVPIKGKTANRVNIDPLAMQTYKCGVCFLTSWIVLWMGEPLTFTWWGLLSGFFWVPGGTAGIYAVRNAGMAVSQGIWSTLKVAVALIWGILIFDDQVKTRRGTTVAALLMTVGLWGMSYYSSSSSKLATAQQVNDDNSSRNEDEGEEAVPIIQQETSGLEEPLLPSASSSSEEASFTTARQESDSLVGAVQSAVETLGNKDESELPPTEAQDETVVVDGTTDTLLVVGCCKLKRRRLGLLCACFDGLWGGSILVPMHFAKTKAEGLGYVISFATGATTVLIAMWLLRLVLGLIQTQSLATSWNALPSLHLASMWLPGGIAGLLWSIGNFCSILAVANLGEGVGYSIVQSQMLISGLWGVVWYREVQGWRSIMAWFAFAATTLAGIVLLSHEHVRKH